MQIHGKLFNSRKRDGSVRQEVFVGASFEIYLEELRILASEELEVKKEANKPFSGPDEKYD